MNLAGDAQTFPYLKSGAVTAMRGALQEVNARIGTLTADLMIRNVRDAYLAATVVRPDETAEYASMTRTFVGMVKTLRDAAKAMGTGSGARAGIRASLSAWDWDSSRRMWWASASGTAPEYELVGLAYMTAG